MIGRSARVIVAPAVVALMALALEPNFGFAQGRGTDLPRVRLIVTGGTIGTRGQARLTADEIVQLIPGVSRFARPEAEQFSNVASTALTLDQWLQLSRRLGDLFERDPGLAGAVVTCGTDSLEELAYFLHLTVRSDKPVVMVGAMRSVGTPGYDGAANLLDAFRVAALPESRGKGVMVVMNNEINSAREATKTDAQRLETFQSRGYGLLGVVDPDRVVFFREPLKRHTTRSEFDLRGITALPRVDIILFYQGAPEDLVRAAVGAGAKGLVVAMAGADVTGGSLGPGIAFAVRQGLPVVAATRTGSGRIPQDSVARAANGLVAAEDLTPVKARILLMLALTRTRQAPDIQRVFSEY